MKIIQTGNDFKIFGDDLVVKDHLPEGVYKIYYNSQEGWSMGKIEDTFSIEEKVYGIHKEKSEKVMDAFIMSNRSLGVLLSGHKGIGKSLFAKMLCIDAIWKLCIPVVVVDYYIPGIADFIAGLEQQVCVLFDEFDKMFAKKGDVDPQAEFLSLFDGVSQQKHLYIITTNSLQTINDYLVNRPGRFHYHFRFEYPTADEIAKYLIDQGITGDNIKKVQSFSAKVPLNYDCLRAIAFELKLTDEPFETVIKDLNILNLERKRYNITIYFTGNKILRGNKHLDMFDNEQETILFEIPHSYDNLGRLEFIPSDVPFDISKGCYTITADNGGWEFDKTILHPDKDDFENNGSYEEALAWGKEKFLYATITPDKQNQYHYTM